MNVHANNIPSAMLRVRCKRLCCPVIVVQHCQSLITVIRLFLTENWRRSCVLQMIMVMMMMTTQYTGYKGNEKQKQSRNHVDKMTYSNCKKNNTVHFLLRIIQLTVVKNALYLE